MEDNGAYTLPNPENSLNHTDEEKPAPFTYVNVNGEVTRTCVYNELRRLLLEVEGVQDGNC